MDMLLFCHCCDAARHPICNMAVLTTQTKLKPKLRSHIY